MTNREKLLSRMSRVLEHVRLSESEKTSLIDEAFSRVCFDTEYFRYLFPFELLKGIYEYDLHAIAAQSETVRRDVGSLQLTGTIDPSEIIAFLSTGDTGSGSGMIEETDVDPNPMKLVNIHGFFGYSDNDKKIYSADSEWFPLTKYRYRFVGSSSEFGKIFVFEASVVPDIDDVEDKDIQYLIRPIFEYVRYLTTSDIASQVESQSNNYEYMRYFNEVKSVRDRIPDRFIYSCKEVWL